MRPFDPAADAAAMVEVYCDPEVMRYIPGGPLSGVGVVRAILEQHTRSQAERGFASWAVVERATGRVIGDVGFGIFAATGEVEIGYTLARDAWGRGYATEAAKATLGAGLSHLAVPRVVAAVDAENERSVRIPQKIGMTRLGLVEAYGRPHVLFAAYPTTEGRSLDPEG